MLGIDIDSEVFAVNKEFYMQVAKGTITDLSRS